MKKEDDDLPLYDGHEEEDFDDDNDYEFVPEDLPDCPLTDMVISSIMMSKPFGINWDFDKMKNFLVKRGYRIIKRYSESRELEYEVAIEPGSSFIPDEDFSNIRDIFEKEVQDILSEWLLNLNNK